MDNGADTVPNCRGVDDVGVNAIWDVGVDKGADMVPNCRGVDDAGMDARVDDEVDTVPNNARGDASLVRLCNSLCIVLRGPFEDIFPEIDGLVVMKRDTRVHVGHGEARLP